MLILALTGCAVMACSGSDDSQPTASAESAATSTPSTDSSVCPAEPFTGSIERTAEAETGDGVHVAAKRTDAELMSAFAYDFGTGDIYTVYVGDYEIDREAVGDDTLVAPRDGLLATIFVMSDEPLVAGVSVDFSFVPIVDTGGGAQISGFGSDDVVGEITIIGLTDERICFEIDSTDPQQSISGVVSAEITGP